MSAATRAIDRCMAFEPHPVTFSEFLQARARASVCDAVDGWWTGENVSAEHLRAQILNCTFKEWQND